MYNIYLNTNDEGYNFEQFSKKFIDICNEHKKNGQALAFAFILYDFDNAQIRKVLDDSHYWESLNYISGKYLSVFSFNYKRKKELSNHKIEYLTSVNLSNKQNINESSKNIIKQYFGKMNVKFPSILFFQVNDQKVIDLRLIELGEEKIEESFIEIKKFLTSAVEALKDVHEENYKNIEVIFDNLKDNIEATNLGIKFSKAKSSIGSLISLVASLKKIF